MGSNRIRSLSEAWDQRLASVAVARMPMPMLRANMTGSKLHVVERTLRILVHSLCMTPRQWTWPPWARLVGATDAMVVGAVEG